MPEFQLSTPEILHSALEARHLPGESALESYKVFIQPLGDCIEVNHRTTSLRKTFRFNWSGTLLGYFTDRPDGTDSRLIFDRTSGYGNPKQAFSDTQVMLQELQENLFGEKSPHR
ncbi:hypothetical protein AAFN60_19040 [Roseibacillus persicicus]|uniref:hypothetical protein n=1 Tax=Roseibacillus persicicus TaxID=454148 RepID=UPI00398ACB7E